MTFMLCFTAVYGQYRGKLNEISKFSVIWLEECVNCSQVNVVIIRILRAIVLGAGKKPETNFCTWF